MFYDKKNTIVFFFSSLFQGNMKCKIDFPDTKAIDCQEHLLSCQRLQPKLCKTQQVILKEVKYADIFGCLEEQKQIVSIFDSLLNMRADILESLPVGTNTGPIIAVTPI